MSKKQNTVKLSAATRGYSVDVSAMDQKSRSAWIDGKISSVRSRGKQLKTDTHYIGLAAIDHYIDCGDWTKVKALHEAIRDCVGSSIGQAFVTYVVSTVPSLTWNDTEKTFQHTKGAKRHMVDTVKWSYQGGKASYEGNPREFPYFELEVKKSQAPTTLEAKVIAFAKSIATGINNDNIKYDATKDSGFINLIEQMVKDVDGGADLVKNLEAAINPEETKEEAVAA